MRIGAIFARGSCRALKWMALFGVVFALGADSVSAQLTRSGTTKKWTATEGDSPEFKFKFEATAPAGYPGGTVTFTLLDLRNSPGTGDAVYQTSTDPRTGDPTAAESGDLDLTGPGASVTVTFPANTGTTGVDHTIERTLSGFIDSDPDAEDEIVGVRVYMTIPVVANPLEPKGGGTAFVSNNDVDLGVLTINDPHDQTFAWVSADPATAADGTGGPVENAPASITVRAVPAPDNYNWRMQARSDSNRYPMVSGVSAEGFQIMTGNTEQEISVGGANTNDGERDDTDVMVTLYYTGTSERIPGLEPYTFKFKDIHKLPADDKITWKAYASTSTGARSRTEVTSITEGAEHPVHVVVTADRGTTGYPMNEGLKVTPMNDGQRLDYRTEDAPVTISDTGTGKKTGTFKVWALADDDVGDEDLVLNLKVEGVTATNGPGDVMAKVPVSLTIEDETAPLLTTKTDAEVMAAVAAARTAAVGDDNKWTPGESFSLMENDLFNMVDDNAIELSARATGSNAVRVSTTGDSIMLTAVEAGKATVRVTGTVSGSSAVMQTVANVASVEFEVEVDQLDLAITLSGPADMNIAEGMSAMVTATANRAVTANTTVELITTGGSASPGDWSAENIMIMAGETMGTTMLMANEDGMEEPMETLMIEGRFGGMKTNMLTFNLWDAAVPALPVIAQLLLAAFLAIGGYRRYLRRR